VMAAGIRHRLDAPKRRIHIDAVDTHAQHPRLCHRLIISGTSPRGRKVRMVG
jgi:hypothetical protein